jgi:hypothetical protein
MLNSVPEHLLNISKLNKVLLLIQEKKTFLLIKIFNLVNATNFLNLIKHCVLKCFLKLVLIYENLRDIKKITIYIK